MSAIRSVVFLTIYWIIHAKETKEFWQKKKEAKKQKFLERQKQVNVLHSECACSSVCRTLGNVSHRFYTDANVQRISQHSLAILEHNTVYRVDDLLRHSGYYWRRDSISVLCEDAFRGTVLRAVLRNTSLIDGKPIPEWWTDQRLELKISNRKEDEVGHALIFGESGPNNVTLGNTREQIVEFSRIISMMFSKGLCSDTYDDELVVPLRLGDVQSDPGSAISRFDEYISTCGGQNIRKVVVVAVLHYGYNVFKMNGSLSTRFGRSGLSDAASVEVVHKVVLELRSRGFKVRVRSEPNVDLDLCFAVYAPHILSGIAVAQRVATQKKGGLTKEKQTQSGFEALRTRIGNTIREQNFGSMPPPSRAGKAC